MKNQENNQQRELLKSIISFVPIAGTIQDGKSFYDNPNLDNGVNFGLSLLGDAALITGIGAPIKMSLVAARRARAAKKGTEAALKVKELQKKQTAFKGLEKSQEGFDAYNKTLPKINQQLNRLKSDLDFYTPEATRTKQNLIKSLSIYTTDKANDLAEFYNQNK